MIQNYLFPRLSEQVLSNTLVSFEVANKDSFSICAMVDAPAIIAAVVPLADVSLIIRIKPGFDESGVVVSGGV